VVRIVRTLLLLAGLAALGSLIYSLGAGSIAEALARITWGQFLLLCLLFGLNVGVDTVGWQYTLKKDRAPFLRLLAARCAGEAASALTTLAAVGGEAIKAWLVRREIPYEESVPSLILAKTAEVIAQTMLFAVAVLLAWSTRAVDPALAIAMSWLLLVQAIGVAGFVAVQMGGVVGKAGRLLAWGGIDRGAQRLDTALRGFYRDEWRRFLLATAIHLAGWLVGIVDALVILWSLGLSPSPVTATILEALWAGVRFATFFIPGSLGPLEGATAAAFPALGFAASAGLAFTLVRRARQVVWIALGAAILVMMRPAGASQAALPARAGEERPSA
jgi:uncharacterized protein (TIRG00374 family)